MSVVIKCKNPRFLSVQDEISFLNWTKKIKSIKLSFINVKDLLIECRKKPSSNDLKELLALFERYRLNKSTIIKKLQSHNS